MQKGAIAPGANVIVIDDLIATGNDLHGTRATSLTAPLGGSAKAAGDLVKQEGGHTAEYLFIVGLTFLQGTSKLDAPAYTMIEVDD